MILGFAKAHKEIADAHEEFEKKRVGGFFSQMPRTDPNAHEENANAHEAGKV